MGKKGKREKEVEKFPIDAEVANFEAKYSSILPYVDANLVRKLYETSIPNENIQNGVSWNINANFTVEKKFFLALKELVLAGDIDLEIAIIEQFMPVGRMLIKRLGYHGADLDNKVETAITDTIENYPGIEGFNSTLLKELKAIVKGREEPVFVVVPETVLAKKQKEVVPVPIPEIDTLVVEEREKAKEPVSSSVLGKERKLVLPNDEKERPATTLDQLLFNIDILKASPLQDEMYLQFLSLKYGYHNKQFFSLKEISEILSISPEVAKDYYLQSLQFVKDWFGLQLDRYYTYTFSGQQKSE